LNRDTSHAVLPIPPDFFMTLKVDDPNAAFYLLFGASAAYLPTAATNSGRLYRARFSQFFAHE
jgi:hypothetical protein